jgi:hypothetical protein
VGVKALRTQLGQTLGIAQVSDTAEQYEANIRRVFGGQGDLFKKMKEAPTEAPPLAPNKQRQGRDNQNNKSR